MHELILLRHAEAQPAPKGGEDHSRRLSGHGEQEARAAGKWLAKRGLKPDLVLCSPSERTRSTASLALAALKHEPALKFADDIYEATPGELLALLDEHGEAGTVMLVGHNPGIERLVALLVEGRSDEFRGMPPGGPAVLH